MIFVDTGAWYAFAVTADRNHPAATRWLHANRTRLITTDYVIDETLALLRSRGFGALALSFGASLLDESLTALHVLSLEDVVDTWRVSRQIHDKE
ncbi:MAG: PIN domain-containing protein [Chloroflexota bacterium]